MHLIMAKFSLTTDHSMDKKFAYTVSEAGSVSMFR